MMQQMMAVLITLLWLSACTRDKDLMPPIETTTWTIGAQSVMDSTLVLPFSPEAALSLTGYSVCPSHSVSLVVKQGSDLIVIDTTLNAEARSIHITPQNQHDLNIQTALFANGGREQCVWLGQATFTYQYTQ